MADTSGIVQTNVLDGTYFWVKWSVKTQGLVNNAPITTINWSCGVYTAHNYYLNAIRMSAFTINGTQVYGGGTYSNFSRLINNTLAYGELQIPHNSDGTKSFSVSSFSGWIYDTGSPTAGAKSYTLPSIAVKAIITSAPNFNDNSNPTISYNNAAGSSVYELQACISLTGATDDIAYRDISKTGNSYTFNLTDEERNVLRNATTGNPPSRSVYFFVRTRMTSTSAYSHDTALKTFTVIPSDATNPTEAISVSPVGNLPSAFDGLYVQGKVKSSVIHTATFKNGATAAAYTTFADGKTYGGASVTTDFINTAGSLIITGTVKDSRGFTASDSKTIDVIPYTKPAVAQIPGLQEIVCARCDEDGALSASGIYLKVRCSRRYSTVTSGGVQKNFCILRLRVGSGAWITLLSKVSAGDTYDGVVPGVTLNVDSVYTVQIEAIDDIGEVHDIYFDIPTEEVPLHLGEGGKSVGIGRYASESGEKRLDVAWDAHFEKGLQVSGATTLDGNLTGKYLTGTLLQTTSVTDLGTTPPKIAVVDGAGWIYTRTPEEMQADLGYADYIVEQGTSGIWTYRKWNSGAAECWGNQSFTTAVSTASGGGYRSSMQTPALFPANLFISAPVVTDSVNGTSDYFVIMGHAYAATKNNMGAFYLWRPTSAASIACDLHMHAIGRWK